MNHNYKGEASRCKILDMLRSVERFVSSREIGEFTGLCHSAVCYNIRVMIRDGIIRQRKQCSKYEVLVPDFYDYLNEGLTPKGNHE